MFGSMNLDPECMCGTLSRGGVIDATSFSLLDASFLLVLARTPGCFWGMSFDMTTRSRQIAWFTASLLTLVGCDLPSIPGNLNPPTTTPDMGEEDMSDPRLCIPGMRGCFASSVRVCDEDGRGFTTEVCPASEVCRDGACVDATETCDDDVLVAISQTRIFFDVNDDLKPTSTTLSLTNCEGIPLRIQKASIVSPERRDGSYVFDFDISTGAPQGLTIDPGVTVDSKIVFRPREREWIERGTLYLTIEGGADVLTREVEMLSSSWCLTSTPHVPLGDVERDVEVKREVKVHNCGSRSLLLSGAQLIHEEPGLEWSIEGLDRPRTLQPGQELSLDVAFIPRETGRFLAAVELVLNPQEESNLPSLPTPTRLEGMVYEGDLDCREVEVSDPSLEPLVQRSDGSRPLTIYALTSDELPESDWSARHSVRALDDFGSPPLVRTLPGLANASWWIPYMSGDFEIETRFFDSFGVPSCEVNTLDFNGRNGADHYIELVWYAPDDPIHEDEGAGLGVDLDLHARPLYEDGSRGRWNTPVESCFGEAVRCASGAAELRSVSTSGAVPESLAIDGNGDAENNVTHFDVGVHLAHSNLFSTSCASLRIWRGGEIVATIPEAGDDAVGCERGRAIQGTDSFWYVGRLSLEDGTLDQSEQAFRPNGFPRD